MYSIQTLKEKVTKKIFLSIKTDLTFQKKKREKHFLFSLNSACNYVCDWIPPRGRVRHSIYVCLIVYSMCASINEFPFFSFTENHEHYTLASNYKYSSLVSFTGFT